MKKKFLEILKGFISRNFRNSREIIVFAVFVLISSSFWFISSLGDNYDADVDIKMVLENIPDDKMILSGKEVSLDLKVSGTGYDILKYKLGKSRKKILLDIANAPLRKSDNDSSKFFLLTNQLQINRGYENLPVRIMSVNPDTLFFYFGKNVVKRVPIIPKINIVPQKQYQQKGDLLISPDSVTISGPSSIVDSISEVSTELIELLNLDKKIIGTYSIIPIENVKINPDKVEVTVDVEQFTENNFYVPVKVSNVPDSIEVKIFPSKVKVRYRVGLSNYELVKESDFEVLLNYDSIKNKTDKYIPVSINSYPHFVSNPTVDPNYSNVEVIIEVK